MKTLILLLLLVSTTNVFSQGKYINKKEYYQLMKRFEGETKDSRGQVIVAFEEWLHNQNYFTILEGEGEKALVDDKVVTLNNNIIISDLEGKYKATYNCSSNLKNYKVSILEKFDKLRERAFYIHDTIINTEYLGKAHGSEETTFITMGREVKSYKIIDVEKMLNKNFEIKFETSTNIKKRTMFRITVVCKHEVFEIGKTTPELEEYFYNNVPVAYSFDIIKEIQDYIYKKVGK